MAKFKLLLVQVDDGTPEAKTATAQALSRQLRITALTLVFTMGMIVAVTIAWFAMNKNVDSGGMQMNVETNPNLVIADSAAGIAAATATDAYTSVSFTPEANLKLVPATYYGTGSPYNSTTGLIYNTNPDDISMTTGHAKIDPSTSQPYTGHEEAFEAVPSAASGPYYRDYEVYIASADQALEVSDAATKKWQLNATFSGELGAAPTGTKQKDYKYAASVDLYLVDDSGNTPTYTYKGTLNLTHQYTDGTQTPVDLLSSSTVTSIPLNTSGYYRVLMRVYFDGAVNKSTGQAYVYSSNLDTNNITLNIHFEAKEVNAS